MALKPTLRLVTKSASGPCWICCHSLWSYTPRVSFHASHWCHSLWSYTPRVSFPCGLLLHSLWSYTRRVSFHAGHWCHILLRPHIKHTNCFCQITLAHDGIKCTPSTFFEFGCKFSHKMGNSTQRRIPGRNEWCSLSFPRNCTFAH